MRARSTRFGAVAAAAAALSWNVAASGQHLYRVKENMIGCASPRAAAALSSSDPRRSDPNWVRSVMNDGGCLVVTPASRWALVRFGQDFLVRNVVPGDGRELYISAYELSEIFPATPSPAAAKPVTLRGQETFTVGRVGHANRSLTLRKMADGGWISASTNGPMAATTSPFRASPIASEEPGNTERRWPRRIPMRGARSTSSPARTAATTSQPWREPGVRRMPVITRPSTARTRSLGPRARGDRA